MIWLPRAPASSVRTASRSCTIPATIRNCVTLRHTRTRLLYNHHTYMYMHNTVELLHSGQASSDSSLILIASINLILVAKTNYSHNVREFTPERLTQNQIYPHPKAVSTFQMQYIILKSWEGPGGVRGSMFSPILLQYVQGNFGGILNSCQYLPLPISLVKYIACIGYMRGLPSLSDTAT